jgi:hypothetical protein
MSDVPGTYYAPRALATYPLFRLLHRPLDQQAAIVALHNAAIARQLPIAAVRDACALLPSRLDGLACGQKRHRLRTLIRRITVVHEKALVERVWDALSTIVPLESGAVVTTSA